MKVSSVLENNELRKLKRRRLRPGENNSFIEQKSAFLECSTVVCKTSMLKYDGKFSFHFLSLRINRLGRDVRKPINANLRLDVNRGFQLAR